MGIYSKYESRIYAYILSVLPNMADAEDVLQETSLLLWQKFDQFEPGTDFVAWACQIAKYRILKLREKRKRSRLLFQPEVMDAIANEMVQMGQSLDARQAALIECVRQLPVHDRELLQMRYSGNASPKQIAEERQRTVHAIYKALSRVHSMLLECIQRKVQ